jgi:tetratricopeptide (TPR) repeat protein
VNAGDKRQGVADLKAFVAMAPEHDLVPAAKRLITQTLAHSGDRSDLQEAYTQLMSQEPPTAEALYDAGAIAGKLGHAKDQATAWRRLRKEFPRDPLVARAALELANAAFKRKDWKEASAQAHVASRSDEDALRAEALLLHGESELKLSRFGTAAKSFEAVGSIKSAETGTRYRALAGLGLAREQLKETRAAITAYETVAAKSPDSTLRDWARDRAAALREQLPKPAPRKAPAPKAGGSRSNGSRDGGS